MGIHFTHSMNKPHLWKKIMNSIYKFDFDVNEDILILEYDKI